MSEKPDRPIYCGNFEYEAREREIERLFDKYGDVERVDMKEGFAFVYMKRKDDGDYAIRKLDGTEFGYKRRKLKVEWSQPKVSRAEQAGVDISPTSTLFVVNFNTINTTSADVERHFEPFGRLKRVEIKKNYAFVQYDTVEEAKAALEATNGQPFNGHSIVVEYVRNTDPGAARERDRDRDRGGRGGYSDRYGRGRSRSRSRSPRRRSRSRDRRRSYSR